MPDRAMIDESVRRKDSHIGDSSMIREWCTIRDSWTGKGCKIYERTSVKKCCLGKNVDVNANCYLENADIGDDTMIGPNCSIVGVTHEFSGENGVSQEDTFRRISIGSRCWLGAGVIVLPGVTIGDGAIIAAGSIVNIDVPSFHIHYGHPANRRLKLIGKK